MKKTNNLQEHYLDWYKQMLLIRKFEEKASQLYFQQKIRGFCHLYNGQEACIVGTVAALKATDKYITAYRDHAHPIALGTEPKYIMAELFGKSTGISKGKGGSMHMFDKQRNFFGGHGIVGAQIPLGVGIAFAEKYLNTENICVTFLGDGAVWQGAFHESLNLAMLYELPVLFIIENNGYAMGTSVKRSTKIKDLHKIADTYQMLNLSIDAMCVENVYNCIAELGKAIRKDSQPRLVEFRTYRYKGHSISDPAKYRSSAEVTNYKEQDPILNLLEKLKKHKLVDEAQLETVQEEIKNIIQHSVKFAEKSSFLLSEEVYTDVYKQNDYPFHIF